MKKTKRALLLSAIAVVMSIAMLIGSTFAWFTDSASTAVNTIQSGTLKVALEYSMDNGETWQNAEGETLNWVTTDEVENVLWEPNCTYSLPLIRVRNDGNLALKYEISVIGAKGDLELLDVIDFTASIDGNDEVALSTFTGHLDAYNASSSILIKGHMDKDAGNDYQGLEIKNIAINVLATQYTYESDSIDNQYDKNADYAVAVTTADELKSAIANGNNIILAADLDLKDWTSAEFGATLDGNGHTISNLTVGLFSTLRGATVKNLTIDNADVTGGTSVGIVAERAYSGTVIENVTVSGKLTATGYYVGGIVGASMSKSNSFISCVNNAEVTGGQHVGGIVGHGAYGVNIIDCTNNGNITATGSFGPFAGGIVGFMTGWMNYSDGLVITVEDCVNNGNITSTNVTNAPKIGSIAGALGREGGDTAVSPLVAYINNCTDAKNTGLAICGGSVRYDNGKDDGLYLFIDGVCDKATKVSNADALKNALVAGGYVILNDDIVMNGSVSPKNSNFVLDGAGHTITMAADATNTYALFDITGGTATIKNVTFDGIKDGAIVRTVGVRFNADNVTAENGNHTQVQGIFRLVGKNTIENCTFKNNVCNTVITFNFDDDTNNDPQVVKNCVFENNTCKNTAVVYYVTGASATIDGNEFVNNNVTVTGGSNAATLYMGFTEGNTITNNVFKNNTVKAGTSKRVAGAVMVGYETVITNNAFIDNKVEGTNAKANDVCASVYHTDIDLSGNYWGGSAPVENDNYFVEYPDSNDVIINDYLTRYGN